MASCQPTASTAAKTCLATPARRPPPRGALTARGVCRKHRCQGLQQDLN